MEKNQQTKRRGNRMEKVFEYAIKHLEQQISTHKRALGKTSGEIQDKHIQRIMELENELFDIKVLSGSMQNLAN